MINKGTKGGMMKLQDFAMKQVKSENDPEIEEEVDLDEGTEDSLGDFQDFARLYGGGDEIYVVTQGKDSNSLKVIGIEKDPNKAKKIRDRAKGARASLWGQMKSSQKVLKLKIGDPVSFEDSKNKLSFIEEVDLDEASARADAMRAMRKDKSIDPADVDTDASDDDVKSASKNIIMQLRKSVSLRGNFKVEFMDKKKVKVSAKIAQGVQNKYNSMKKATDKEKFQAKISKSYKDMLSALKENYGNKQESTILDRVGKKLREIKNG